MANNSFVLELNDANAVALDGFLNERLNDDYVSIGDPKAARTIIFFARHDYPSTVAELDGHKLDHFKNAIKSIKNIQHVRPNEDGGERWIIVLAFFSRWLRMLHTPFLKAAARLHRTFNEFPAADFILMGIDCITAHLEDVEEFYDDVTDDHGRQFQFMIGGRLFSGTRDQNLHRLTIGVQYLWTSSYKALTITSANLPENFQGAHEGFCEIEGQVKMLSKPLTTLIIDDVVWHCCQTCKDHFNSMKAEGQPWLCPPQLHCPHCNGFRNRGFMDELNQILLNHAEWLDNLH